MTTHPPKPRLALAVGITGHRPNKLPEEARATVAARIAELLQGIAAAAGDAHRRHAAAFSPQAPRLSLLSALAEGADRIAADAALDAGYRLEALLPFLRDDYAADFTEADSLAEYRALLGRADAVMELPGRRDEEARAYEEAGQAMLDHCTILIAVWDGGRAAGRGGTGEIIDAAARRGLPVLLVDATGRKRPELRWRDLEPHPLPTLRFDDLPAHDPAGRLAELVDEVLRPPAGSPADGHGAGKGPDRGEAARLAAYFAETRRRFHWRPEWHLLMALAGVRKPGRADLCSPSPRDSADALGAVTADPPGTLRSAYGWADALGIRYARIFRSAIVTNFLFAALSVFIVALSILSQKSLHLLVDHKWAFVLVELLLILTVIVNTRCGKRGDWHRRWLEAREVAERLRVAIHMTGLGSRPPTAPGRIGIWTAWYGRALLRAAGLPRLALTAAATAEARRSLMAMLADQCRYHRSVQHQLEAMEHRLERFGEALFFTTLAIALLFVLSALAGLHPGDELKYAVTALTAGLPVLATASYGIRVIADFEGNAQRSGRMAGQLEALIGALGSDDPADLRAAQDRARQAADIMLGDLATWRLTAEGRGLAIPG